MSIRLKPAFLSLWSLGSPSHIVKLPRRSAYAYRRSACAYRRSACEYRRSDGLLSQLCAPGTLAAQLCAPGTLAAQLCAPGTLAAQLCAPGTLAAQLCASGTRLVCHASQAMRPRMPVSVMLPRPCALACLLSTKTQRVVTPPGYNPLPIYYIPP